MKLRILLAGSAMALATSLATPAFADATVDCNVGAGGIETLECGVNATTGAADFATAIGTDSSATGYGSTATGNDADATGDYSSAFGAEATASGYEGLAIGDFSIASGD